MPDRAAFIQSYEGHFSCKMPIELKKDGTPKNEVEYRLWMSFIDGLDVEPDRLFEKATELRGRSRMRPSLADLKQVANICRDGATQEHRVECGFCDSSGWIVVIVNFDPSQSWKKTAKIGHHHMPGHILGTCTVPCLCSNGKPNIRTENDERVAREGAEWRKNFIVEGKLLGRNPVAHEREVVTAARMAYQKGATP